MNILIDTHILVKREVDRTIERRLQEILQAIGELNHKLVVHPLSVTEVEKDKNIPQKSVLLSKIRTYPFVNAPENLTDDDAFIALIGKPKSEREKVDSCLLYSLYKNEVDFFLTEDMDIMEKAGRLQISPKVMNLRAASSFFKRILKERKSKGGDAPVFCFYKKGSKWYIGEKGKESTFDDLQGFKFIHFLLSREYQDLEPRTVYHGEKSMANEFTDRDILEGSEDLEDLHGDSALYIKNLDAKGRNEIEKRLRELRAVLDLVQEEHDLGDYLSPVDSMVALEEKKEKIEGEIKKLERVLQQRSERDPKSEAERARVNVTRAIKLALKKITEDPSISSTSSYLNKSTIKTGDSCSYRPALNNKPTWILDSETENQ